MWIRTTIQNSPTVGLKVSSSSTIPWMENLPINFSQFFTWECFHFAFILKDNIVDIGFLAGSFVGVCVCFCCLFLFFEYFKCLNVIK